MELPGLPSFIEAQLPPDISRKTLQIEGLTLHYLQRGKGIPVLLMHGNPSWSFIYRNIMAELDPEKYCCIAPDLPGLGLSSKPKAPSFYSLENYSRIMGKFVKEVIREDFIFIGQDWGGPIGLLASMQASHEMKGMVLLNTMIRPPKDDFRPTAFHTFSRKPILSDIVFRAFRFPQAYLHKVQGQPASIRGWVRKAYTWPLRKWQENKAPLMLARMVPDSQTHPSIPFLQQTEAFAHSFQGPVSLVWGKKDPILGRLATAHQKLMPQAQLKTTEGGHFIQEEYPELIARTIEEVAKAAF